MDVASGGRGLMPERGRGFTLLELVVVVAILAVAAGLVVATLGPTQDDALSKTARSEIATLRDACLRWKADLGSFPASLGDLKSATPPAALPIALQSWNPNLKRGWRGPYVTSGRLIDVTHLGDPWTETDPPALRLARAYGYQVAGGQATITSAGPDRELITADDLTETFP